MLERIHHINFLVRDLDRAVERYRVLLGVTGMRREELAERGVRIARFRLGETWVVLVEPTRPDSIPGRYLAEHGEGFFLMSLEVDDLEESARSVATRGGLFADERPRQGLDDWVVRDLDPGQFHGALLQLVEEKGRGERRGRGAQRAGHGDASVGENEDTQES